MTNTNPAPARTIADLSTDWDLDSLAVVAGKFYRLTAAGWREVTNPETDACVPAAILAMMREDAANGVDVVHTAPYSAAELGL